MAMTFATGAAMLVKSTTAASSHSPSDRRLRGPEKRSAVRNMPPALTVISGMRQATPSRTRAETFSASARPSGSRRARRSSRLQRRQRAAVPGRSAGTTCRCPQSGHSERWRGVMPTGPCAPVGSAALSVEVGVKKAEPFPRHSTWLEQP